MDGDLALLFAHVVIGDGRAVCDAPHPVEGASANQHGLTQGRFARRRVPDDGEVSDVSWLICLHESS